MIAYGTNAVGSDDWVDDDGTVHADADGKLELHSGQARIAYRLAKAHRDKLLYVAGIGWHSYDGTRWCADDRGAAKRAVLEVLRVALAQSLDDKDLRADVKRCESAAGVAGVLDLAAALVPFAATVRDLDVDPYLFNAANGTLDLRTGTLRQHRPCDRMTKVSRAAYDPAADGRSWNRFLAQVLPDPEVRGFLQRVAGVALAGLVIEHVLVILTGTGANGKGTGYKALNYALGDYASTAEPDLFMHRQGAHPTGEMDLLGVRLVVVSESEKDRRLAEATMKRLTGGDTIRARRMRQDFVEFAPSHTAILVTNHLPKVSGDDPAIWRRLRVVPFDVVIPEVDRDVHLDERLQLDADAILSWAVAGYASYVQRRGLDEPKSVLAATEDYQRSSDAVRRFLDDEDAVVRLPSVAATTTQLHHRWVDWARSDGSDELSARAFGQALDRLGFVVTKANGAKVRRGIGVVTQTYEDER